jgi:1,4-dihydroxy-6-naphthoate synthase
MKITIRCSPDADDLFMMRALTLGLIDTEGLEFDIDTGPTDQLNRLAATSDPPDVVALSFGKYPDVAHDWQLFPHSGSMGEGYGPVVVAREPIQLTDLVGMRVGIPGLTTTAWATLRLMVENLEPVVVPIVPTALIFDALRDGRIDAGLVIHEGRLTYEAEGFHRVAELGEWWSAETGGLPLPLGATAIRRSLGAPVIEAVSRAIYRSIEHGLTHRDEAIDWLLESNGTLRTREELSEYLGMYANETTLDYGVEGRAGIEAFYQRLVSAGHLREMPPLDYVPL